MPHTTTSPVRLRQGGYLSKTCGEQIAKDNMPITYPVDLQEPVSAFMQDLFDGGNDFEDRIGELLQARVPAGELAFIVEAKDADGERTKDGKRTKEEDTFAAYLDPNVRVIFNARIGPRFEELVSEHLGYEVVDHDRISEPDIIELGEVMEHGLRAMRFIDVKWHKITSGKSVNPKSFWYSDLDAPYLDSRVDRRDFYGTVHNEDWRQLAHYYRHARKLGLAKPESDGGAWAAVIGKEEIAVWADLDQISFQQSVDGKRVTRTALDIYDTDYRRALAIVDNAMARDTDKSIEPLTFPELKTDCSECPWRKVCKAELEAFGQGGHITLLPGITPTRAKPLYEQGIRDVVTLASQDPTLEDVPAEFVYTARVALDGRAHLALDTDALDLPRADFEIDFDCESEKTVYMWGVRVNDTLTGTVTEHMFDDYTGTEDGERNVFTAVWKFFQDLASAAVAQGRTVRFYHYTAYERTQMHALAGKYAGQPGVPTQDAVLAFFDDSGTVVDLYGVLAKQVVWPTISHSIKKLAVFAGFAWRDETPGGDMSMLWYRAACSDPDDSVRVENKIRLRRYNFDDVAAQAHLRTWVTSTHLPHVTELAAPKRLAMVAA